MHDAIEKTEAQSLKVVLFWKTLKTLSSAILVIGQFHYMVSLDLKRENIPKYFSRLILYTPDTVWEGANLVRWFGL